MNKKEKRISIAGFLFSAFLILCAVINFTRGSIGAAIASLGSAVFFFSCAYAFYKKSEQ